MTKIHLKIIYPLLLTSFSFPSQAEAPINFVVPSFKPYTYEKNGKIKGIGIQLIKKIMESANISYSVRIVPNYGRALTETKQGRADGFFLASKNSERDSVAIFSKPVTTNRWSWFLPSNSKLNPDSTDFKKSAKIGTQVNTNTHKWLKKNGYTITAKPSNINVLPEMVFQRSRADAVFLAEAVFIDTAEKNNLAPERYKQVVQIEKPFGIYISKNYLSNNPEVMKKINIAISDIIKEKK